MLNIRINKESDVSVRQQLITQIEMAIAIRRLKGGDLMPSVSAPGIRLKIHRNTVSQVYSELVRAGLLVRRRGARLAVRGIDAPGGKGAAQDLDDLINEAIRAAAGSGYTLQDFRRHVLQRFSEDLPSRVLLVVAESLYGDLLHAELADVLTCPIQTCLIKELRVRPAMAEGAIVVSHPSLMPQLVELTGKRHTPVALQYCDTSDCINLIAQLSRPSLIALVSVSQYVMESARLVFSPLVGRRHSITEHVVTEGAPLSVGTADVIICDSLVYRGLAARERKKVVLYRIVSRESVERIRSMMDQAKRD